MPSHVVCARGQTPEEIRQDDDAQALALAMQQTICTQMALADCSQVEITGIDRSDSPNSGRRVLMSVGSDLVAALSVAGGVELEDGVVTRAELANQPKYSNLAQAVHKAMCKQLGDADCTEFFVKSVSTR